MTAQSIEVFRILFADQADSLLAPARNSEGRFHHNGEPALYSSCTPYGAKLALGYYARPDDPPRVIGRLRIENARLFDLRDVQACMAQNIDPELATVRWQKERAAGRPASTWILSDAVRRIGVDGMIYPSSTDASVSHLVLFRWNEFGGAQLRTIAPLHPCNLDD